MKKLLLIFTLLFSTPMFSTPSYGEWKKVPLPSEDGSTHYVDFDGIRKHGGYIYWWELRDNLKIGKGQRIYSMKTYNQGDCGLFRFMILNQQFYNEPMGKGGTPAHTLDPANKNWMYPPPNSLFHSILNAVCNY